LTDKKKRMLPARPALISLVGTWNEYLPPLVMLQQRSTLSLAIGYIMQYQGQYEPISAGAGLREPANGSGHIFTL
jgi:ABC-type glycerol-3-phosphate transport system permease component